VERLDNKIEVNLTRERGDRIIKAMKDQISENIYYKDVVLDGRYVVIKKKRESYDDFGIGDIRVSFYNVPCGPVSIIA